MNVDNIRALADFVASGKGPKFSIWTHRACLMGQAEALWPKEVRCWDYDTMAAKLGLDLGQVAQLVFPASNGSSDLAAREKIMETITPDSAAAVLRNLADTGVVNYHLTVTPQ